MAETLDCPCEWQDDDGTASGSGQGKTKSAARTRARNDSFKKAVDDLQALVRKYECDKDCQLLVEMTVEPASLKRPQPAAPDGFSVSGKRAWSGRVRCTAREFPAGPPEHIEQQDLDCGEKPIGRGTAQDTGKGVDRDTASTQALDKLQTALDLAIEGELLVPDADGIGWSPKVRCPDDDCPKLRIRVRVRQPKVTCQPPEQEGGDWTCDASRDWYVTVRCTG